MRKNYSYWALLLMVFSISISAIAQQAVTISGNVKNSVTNDAVSAVSVMIKGTNLGTFTDDNGNFKITTNQAMPITLIISSVGFATQEVAVSNASKSVSVSFVAQAALAQEVVVAASRTPERILESPVTIERMSTAAIRNAAAPSFYEAIANLKGIDMVTSSITFRTVGTRGFNGSGNLRFNQLIDGMDNQAPGLNFAVGNFLGMTELDADNVEILPGASSALYGAGGMNGTMLLTSKNPFKHQGFSYQIKQGINHTDKSQRKVAPYYDWSMRWAKVVSEKFAFKVAAQFTQGQDWQAVDYRNYNRSTFNVINGNRSTPDYDGVNVYGDDVKGKMIDVANAMVGLGVLPAAALPLISTTQEVSRTGYNERDIVDYNAYNFKSVFGAYYKIRPNVEASLVGYWGIGNTVYTGADRYSLRGVKMGQYKLEVKAPNWFVRAYTTQENSGDAFAANVMASLLNESWKPSATAWFPTYIGGYVQSRLAGASDALAHANARAAADVGRLIPGTPAFNSALNKISAVAIPKGAAFLDKSDLYVTEFQYNFSSLFNNKLDVLVGGSTKQYVLNSEGTLFADTAGRIKINEIGGYIQLQKKLFNDKLKLQAAGRYDKNDNFEGRFTPRFTASLQVAKDNNLRVSYQTGYRFPSTQNQYINLQVPSAKLIGGLPVMRDYFNFSGNPVYTLSSFLTFAGTFQAALAGGATLPAALGAAIPKLEKGVFPTFKPESVASYEVGYRGILGKKVLVDAYWYTSEYTNFIGTRNFVQSLPSAGTTNPAALLSSATRQVYSTVLNIPGSPTATGFGIGFDILLNKGYVFKASYATDTLRNVPAGFDSYFNTPRHRYNFGLSNSNVYKGFGFNVVFRHQSRYFYQATFGGDMVPFNRTVDAQISYRPAHSKILWKIGGSNILNKYYRSAHGNPMIGGMYYISFGYNVF